MNVYLALLLNFLPFLLCFFAFKLFLKLSFLHELFVSALGLLVVLPITFMQFYLLSLAPENLFNNTSDLSGLFCKVLVFNGLLEEGIKALAIACIPGKKLSLKEFFASSLLLGLCLGCFESMIYFLQHLASAKASGAELLYGLIFIRMFSSDLIHTFCAGLGGLFIWGLKNKKFDSMAMIYAIVCHGIFNFFVYFNNWIHWFSFAAILFVLVENRVHYIQAFEKLSEKKSVPEKEKKTSQKNKLSDSTIVTKSPKKVSKSASKTRTKARKAKSEAEESIPEDLDVTPELNEEI